MGGFPNEETREQLPWPAKNEIRNLLLANEPWSKLLNGKLFRGLRAFGVFRGDARSLDFCSNQLNQADVHVASLPRPLGESRK